jgi:hypothetical protein
LDSTEETVIQTMGIIRWSMYAKALKGHIDHLPDIVDQLSGSISPSQGYDRQERIHKMNGKAREESLMWAQTPSVERDISRGEKRKTMISLQRLRLSLQGSNSKDQACDENPLGGGNNNE